MALSFYNSLSRKLEEFKPVTKGEAGMYTCGPTVYDYAHIGNFRAYIFEDLLHRVLRYKGFKVKQIMNITDIDDKTIRNSRESGISLKAYTEKYTKAFFEDIKTLNIMPCAAYPAATDHIDEMVDIIQKLEAKGCAYRKDGSVYFAIDKFPEYGKLAHLSEEQLQAGASGRMDADEYDKDNVRDFVLWKGYTPEDGDVYWETPLGKGRPGWHLECSAMSMKYLGETFDIHTGGIDNLFPHHENEIAQSEASTGKPFVRYWLHCDYLVVEGEKMSKSKGNFFTLRDLLAKGASPAGIRYLLLSTHYRKMLNFSKQGLQAAEASLARLNGFIQEMIAFESASSAGNNPEAASTTDTMLKDFEASLDDDLNIAEALAAVFITIKKLKDMFPLSQHDAAYIISAMKRVDTILGMLSFVPQVLTEKEAALLEQRNAARKEKNFAESDRIRDELASMGVILKDTPQGTVWEKRHIDQAGG